MDDRVEEIQRLRAEGDQVAALHAARQVLQAPGELTGRDLCEVARAGASAAMAAQRYREAYELAKEELRYARVVGDMELEAIAHFHVGTAEMYIGGTADALAAFGLFLQVDTPPRPALDRYRGAALFNVGTVQMRRQHYREAVHAFRMAQAVYEADGSTKDVIRCLLQESWALLMDGRHEPAGLRLEQGRALLSSHPDAALVNTELCHRAFYHWRLREHDEALALCEQLFQAGRSGVTAHHQSEAAWIAGECALAKGDLAAAQRLAEIAQERAGVDLYPPLVNRATDLRRRIWEAGGQTA